MSVWLNELSWVDVKGYLEKKSVILVPIGSTEQHGPACPLGLDTYAAIAIAEDVAKRTETITVPPLWFGDSTHHLGFEGTISLRTETLVKVAEDIVHSLVKHGFKKIVFINGHRGSNLLALNTAVKNLHEFVYPDVFFAVADPFKLSKESVKKLGEAVEFHVGEFETSQILYKFPHLVKKEKLNKEVPDFEARFSKFINVNPYGGGAHIDIPWNSAEQKAFTKSGAMSDSTKASVEKGRAYHEEIVGNLVEFVRWLEKR